MAFKGLPNARIFGVELAGMTTENVALSLSDNSLVSRTALYEIDRAGTGYDAGVQPDEHVGPLFLDDDPVVQAAASWLQSYSGSDTT